MAGVVAACVCATGAQAQERTAAPEAVIVTTEPSTQYPDTAERAAEAVQHELEQRGRHLLTIEEAHRLIDARISRRPTEPAAGLARELAGCAERVLREVAFGRRSQATETATACIANASRFIDSINRDGESARHLFDLCLYRVRATMERRDETSAYAQAQECRRLVPDLEPNRTGHPRYVRAMFQRTGAQLADPRNRLRVAVDLQPAGISCPVYVNGRRMGSTPLAVRLVPGPYRVQVGCGVEEGRVREVVLSSRAVTLTVPTAIDATLGSMVPSAHVRLLFMGGSMPRVAQLRMVGAALHASGLWLVTPIDETRVRLNLMRIPQGTPTGAAVLALDGDRPAFLHSAFTEAYNAILAGRRMDFTEPGVRPMPAERNTIGAAR